MKTTCDAKTRAGTPCKLQPSRGRDRCYLHGGKTPRGLASPHYKHGRYSKHLPERMISDAMQSLADPELLSLNQEIAVMDARVNDLLRRVDTGESGLLWQHLRKTNADLQAAQRERDAAGVSSALTEMGQLIQRGHSDSAAWHEVMDAIDQRRKLAEAERRRRVEMQTMISAERATAMVDALSRAVVHRVADPAVRAAIAEDFREILAGN